MPASRCCAATTKWSFSTSRPPTRRHEDLSSRFTPRRPSHLRDYMLLFERLLPQMVQTLAPQIPYWPSSPSSGGALDSPNDENRGDVHDWDVWHGEKPFFALSKSSVSLRVGIRLSSIPLPGNHRSLYPAKRPQHLLSRDGAPSTQQIGQRQNSGYLAQNYRLPENFSDLLYLSQLLQADAVRCGVEHLRSHRGRCMGAI